MDVYLDQEKLFTISEADLKLLAHDLEDPVAEIKRRLEYIISHKCEQCYKRMRDEWLSRFERTKEVASVPIDRDSFIDLVVNHIEYKNRVQRDQIEKEALGLV